MEKADGRFTAIVGYVNVCVLNEKPSLGNRGPTLGRTYFEMKSLLADYP